MAVLHLQRWYHITLMHVSTCSRIQKNLMWYYLLSISMCAFFFSAPLVQGTLSSLDFLKDGCGRQGGRGEPERQKLLIGGAKCSKHMLLGETNQYFLLNYIAKYHVHNRNSSSIGGAWPPSASLCPPLKGGRL